MRVLRRHDDVTMIGLSKETERGTAGYCGGGCSTGIDLRILVDPKIGT